MFAPPSPPFLLSLCSLLLCFRPSVVVHAFSSPPPNDDAVPPPLPPPGDLKLDTKVRVSHKATAPVSVPPDALRNGVDLRSYMTLPASQYVCVPMPLNSTLSRLPGSESSSEFELVVPPVRFLWLEVQPVVEAVVQTESDRVVISSETCTLCGSDFISKVRLNDRFAFQIHSKLTWDDSAVQSNKAVNADDILCEGGEEDEAYYPCEISAESHISVDVDVPMPFRAIPKRVLERTGNAALGLSLNYLQRNFVKSLAGDYVKWASDPEYRDYRSGLSSATSASMSSTSTVPSHQ